MKNTKRTTILFIGLMAFAFANFFAFAESSIAARVAECTSANQTNCWANSSFKSQAIPTSPALASEVASGKEFYVGGALVVGTMSVQTLSAASTTVSSGTYAATTLNAVDADLITANIRSGVTIFGVAGHSKVVNTGSGDATAANIFTGKKAWVDGLEVTGTMADRGGAWDLTTAFPGAGYYSGITSALTTADVCSSKNFLGSAGTAFCSTTGALSTSAIGHTTSTTRVYTPASGNTYNSATIDLSAAFVDTNICTGKTIFGRAGAAVCRTFASLVGSNIYRTPGGVPAQIKISAEADVLAAGYRRIPDATTDDEAHPTLAARPGFVCGKDIATVAGRIADCATQNGTSAVWVGETVGHAGQATWTLVNAYVPGAPVNGDPCGGGCFEVWRDDRTGLLWSDFLGSTHNWCVASGATTNAGGLDCTAGGAYQAATSDSVCAELAGINTPASYNRQKGVMRKAATGTTPSVIWRLPTIHDWEQADIDGIRAVVPNISTYEYHSATTNSSTPTQSMWLSGTAGNTYMSDRSNTGSVRCVGMY